MGVGYRYEGLDGAEAAVGHDNMMLSFVQQCASHRSGWYIRLYSMLPVYLLSQYTSICMLDK
jgi:hypothetical protein